MSAIPLFFDLEAQLIDFLVVVDDLLRQHSIPLLQGRNRPIIAVSTMLPMRRMSSLIVVSSRFNVVRIGVVMRSSAGAATA